MLVIALVLALIGLVALVFAVVTSNELVAWMCIAASVAGVVLLILDALRERQQRELGGDHDRDAGEATSDEDDYVDYPEEVPAEGEPQLVTEVTTEEPEQSRAAAEGRSDEPAK
jgi:hypothetical protein